MSTTNKSITLTVLVYVGAAIAVAGVVLTFLGWGGAVEFDLKLSDSVSLKANHVGLAVIFLGCALAVVTIRSLPEGTQLYAGPSRPAKVRLLEGPAFILGAIALVVLVISLFLE